MFWSVISHSYPKIATYLISFYMADIALDWRKTLYHIWYYTNYLDISRLSYLLEVLSFRYLIGLFLYLSKIWVAYSVYCIDRSHTKLKIYEKCNLKQIDFDLQNKWAFQKSSIASKAFKIRRSLWNWAVLPVKRISYFLHFSMLYVFYCQTLL